MNYDERHDREELGKMSVEELSNEYVKRFKEELLIRIEDIPGTVSNLIDNAADEIIFGAVGMSKKSNGCWEVSHTNGQATAIGKALGDLAVEQLQLAVPAFLKGIVENTRSRWRDALRREYTDQLYTAISEKFKELIAESVEVRCSSMTDELTEAVKKFEDADIAARVLKAAKKKNKKAPGE